MFLYVYKTSKKLNLPSDNLYATLGRNVGVTIEEYENWSALLDMLYTKG